jgi:K+-sensing histidine kinase KdpD
MLPDDSPGDRAAGIRGSGAVLKQRNEKRDDGSATVSGYFTAILATAIAVCTGVLVDPVLDGGGPLLTPTFVLLLAVMLATRYGGRGPGLFALTLSVLMDAFFFRQPTQSIQISNGRDLFHLGLFVLIAVLVIGVIEAQRAAKVRAEQSAKTAMESEERFRRLVEGRQRVRLFSSGYAGACRKLESRCRARTGLARGDTGTVHRAYLYPGRPGKGRSGAGDGARHP